MARFTAFLILMFLAAPPAAESAGQADDAEAARRLTLERSYQAIDDARRTAGMVPAEDLRLAEEHLAHLQQVIQLLLATNANLKARLHEMEEARGRD